MKFQLVLAVLSLSLISWVGAQKAPGSREIGTQTEPLIQLRATPDGKLLITADEKGSMQAWDLKADKELWTDKNALARYISVGDEVLAQHSGMAYCNVYSLKDGTRESGIGGLTGMNKSTCIAIDPNGTWAWVGTDTGVITRLTPDDVDGWSNRNLKNGGTNRFAMDFKGKILAAGGQNGTVKFIGARSTTIEKKLLIETETGPVLALALDRKLKHVITGGEKGSLQVWKYKSCKLKAKLEEHTANLAEIAVDPKGSRIASGDASGLICVWDLAKGKLLQKWKVEGAITGLVFVEKGETLASSSAASPKITLWDLSELP